MLLLLFNYSQNNRLVQWLGLFLPMDGQGLLSFLLLTHTERIKLIYNKKTKKKKKEIEEEEEEETIIDL